MQIYHKENTMISIIIAQWDDCKALENTLQSILSQRHFFQPELSVIINQMVDCPESAAFIQNQIEQYPNTITTYNSTEDTIYEAYQKAFDSIDSKYVIFALSGDKLQIHGLKHAVEYFESQNDVFSMLSFDLNYTNPKIPGNVYWNRDFQTMPSKTISLAEWPSCAPTSIFGYMFLSSALKEHPFDTTLTYDAGINTIYHLLADKPYLGYIKDVKYTSTCIPGVESSSSLANAQKSWYFETFTSFILPLFDFYHARYQVLPPFVQYAALYLLKWRFQYNANNGDKHIIDEDQEEYFLLCTRVLAHIENSVLFNNCLNPKFTLSQPLKFALLHLKYDGKYDVTFVHDNESILMKLDDTVLLDYGKQKIYIDLLEYQNQNLIIEASTDNYTGFNQMELIAQLNGNPLVIEETYRYAHSKFFGVSVHKRFTFRLTIPVDAFCHHQNALRFYLKHQKQTVLLSIAATTYNAKVDSRVRSAYWMLNKKLLVRYKQSHTLLAVEKSSPAKTVLQEIKMLIRMLYGKSHSISMFLFRIVYWLTRPYMKRKNIWLTYDKLYKGGDCGEYLYRYMCTQKDNVTPAYVLNKNSPDYKRLCAEGYTPLCYGSLKHRLYYVNSSVVFTTHGGVHSFNAFTNAQVKYISGLLHHDVACIQHGLTVQQLAFNSNRLFNNMKRYYCASKYEIQNLSHPIYGYEDKSALKLTGIPRYDGLVNQDKRQILITPTWRNYIAMPATSKNSAKPYNPAFVQTDYFRIYNELLSDPKLIRTAQETGYRLIYLLHPVISAQIEDYPKNDSVEIVPSLTVNYEKILTESSLMVTDYSGVQFDFAYMRKPIIYYHPPKLPPHYKEGGFFYDTMGFGEICTEHQSLVDILCEYMQNNCQVKPFYLARQDDFFAYRDLKSCQRIYDDMMEYQKQK